MGINLHAYLLAELNSTNIAQTLIVAIIVPGRSGDSGDSGGVGVEQSVQVKVRVGIKVGADICR